MRVGVWVLALFLAGCTSEEGAPILDLARSAAVSLGRDDAPSAPPPTRAELDRIPSATLALSEGDGRPAILVPLAENRGYLTYLGPERRGVVMAGAAVASTEALGEDRTATIFSPDDPLAYQRPAAEWPARVTRGHRYRVDDTADYRIVFDCTFAAVARERIVIFEVPFDVLRVVETCTNARRQVVNTHWVEEPTGFVWRSEQWLGPRLPVLTIEVVRPYDGPRPQPF